MTAEEKELREIRQAAGVGAGYSHEDLVILVRNAVPQIARALEFMRELEMHRGQLAAMREALDRAAERASWIRKDRWYKAPEQLATQESEERLGSMLHEISRLALVTDFGKPYADVIAAAVEETEAEREEQRIGKARVLDTPDEYGPALRRLRHVRRSRAKAVERMEKEVEKCPT